jgi:two-component system, NtrC family, sensor histidine kinase PilS
LEYDENSEDFLLNFWMLVLNKVLPPGPREGPGYRKRVEWLVLLRLVVTSFLMLLTVVLQFTLSRSFVGDSVTPLYIILGTTYLLSLIYALALPWISDLRVFSFVQILIDTVYVTALIICTGGASSPFTLLYLFPIISAGVLHLKRAALLLASASSMIFGLFVTLHFYRILPETSLPWVDEWRNHDPGIVLWVLIIHFTIFFFVAVLAGSVAQQLASTKISLGLREIAFEKLSELHTNIVESISSGIATTDEEDRITFVNVPGRSILGMTLSDLLKTPIGKIFPDIRSDYSPDPIKKLIHVMVSKVSGEDRTIEYGVTHLRAGDGRRAGRLVFFQDVTEIRKMEERAKLNEKQESFVRIAAGMAHEIRNPLASLRGAAELLSQRGGDGPRDKKSSGKPPRSSRTAFTASQGHGPSAKAPWYRCSRIGSVEFSSQ